MFLCNPKIKIMFNNIKNRYRDRYILKNCSRGNKQFISLKEAKHIGILTSIANKEEYIDILSIFSQIQQMEKTVKMVAYIDEKQVPYYCLQQLTVDCFCRKDMNWYGKLIMHQVIDFMNTEFDMLIDFTHQFYAPIHTILTLSKSLMITGGNNTQKEQYDLFIDIDEKMNYQKLLENIIIYTSKLTGK
jgi:hypothetical protein